jgi:hypothetical protein
MNFKNTINSTIRILKTIKLKIFNKKKLKLITFFFNKNFNEYQVENPTSTILIDPFTVPEWVITNSYFVNILAKKNNSRIKTYGNNAKIKSPTAEEIFKSFNISGHVQTRIKEGDLLKIKNKIVLNLRKTIDSKQKLYDLKVNDVWIGIDIYETYLKNQRPTIDFNDSLFWSILEEGVEFLLFWQRYFSENSVSGVIISHDCYNHMDILAKVAYKSKVAVYMPWAMGVQKIDEPFSLYKYRFKNYKNYFTNLSDNEKIEALKWSKERLDLRLSGVVGVNMRYSTKSAFVSNHSGKNVIKASDRTKVLIAVHDFFDNPHCYGEMLFTDFYEWLKFLVETSKKTNYDWYIKTHPDYSPAELNCLNDIVLNCSEIVLVPPETSWHQLANEGLNFVLTCWGTVGHELPLLGVQVINASANNPHIAFDFNWHAKTIEEYSEILLDLDSLEKNIDINEIYEFYYLWNRYTLVDDFIFDSYNKMRDSLKSNERFLLKSYLYFIDRLTIEKNKQIIDKINLFLDSNKKNYFINGPEN